jgi:hypothetical protein
MTAPVRCPKGHWFTPSASDKTPVCPSCLAKLHEQKNAAMSDDDVMAILEDSTPQLKIATPESSYDDEELEVKQPSHSHILQRRKKICPTCHYETSYSFAICPRCAGPLKVAELEVP